MFLVTSLGLCLGEEDHRSKLPFSSHNDKGTHSRHNIPLDLDHLAGAVFARRLLRAVASLSFSFPSCPPWKKVT